MTGCNARWRLIRVLDEIGARACGQGHEWMCGVQDRIYLEVLGLRWQRGEWSINRREGFL